MSLRNPTPWPGQQSTSVRRSPTNQPPGAQLRSKKARARPGSPAPDPGTRESVADRCRSHLSPAVEELLQTMAQVGDEADVRVYAVGGFVRDLLLSVRNDDLDLTVEGDGIRFAQRLAARLGGTSRRPSEFGTAVVLTPDGRKIDVATARRETYAAPAALPTIEPGSIRDDLSRRDFSVNTMAFALNGPEAFLLLDWYGGRADLAEGIIRVLHNRSFRDDPTRIFRAIRLEQRFGFVLHVHTLRLLGRAVEKGWIEQLSGPRLWRELRLMLEGTSPVRCLIRLHELEVLSGIDPSLTLSPERVLLLTRTADARAELAEIASEEGTHAWLVYLAALLWGMSPPAIRQVCQRLVLSPRVTEGLIDGMAAVERACSPLQPEDAVRPSQVTAALDRVPVDLVALVLAASPEPAARERIRQYVTAWRHIQPTLSGGDLKQLGVPQGPLIGRLLAQIRAAKLDGEVLTPQAEETFVRHAMQQIEEHKHHSHFLPP